MKLFMSLTVSLVVLVIRLFSCLKACGAGVGFYIVLHVLIGND